jgi:proline iminopeptidase
VATCPAPTLVHDGLAVYVAGDGPAVLLVPSPHGFVLGPAASGELHAALLEIGCTVVTFDPPEAFASRRRARLDLDEMTECSQEALEVLGVRGPVPVVGHSQASLCAVHLTLEHPDQVERLLLVGAVAGGAAVSRADRGLPFSLSRRDPRFWRIARDGTRLAVSGNLAAHRRLLDQFQQLSYADPTLATRVPVRPGDSARPAPARDRWQRRIRRVDLRPRLQDLSVPTLVCAGRHDRQTPLAANAAMVEAIPRARLVVFERSGHYPFIEERRRFLDVAAEFLGTEAT